MTSPRKTQLLWLAVAVGCLVGASMLRAPLDNQRETHDLVPAGNEASQTHLANTFLTIAPGGLRAPIVNYLWIRADNLKQAGRHHEAMQLADLICQLMPRFPGVWAFHAWNMAWNISVTTHTPEERWLWVHNGIELLRDRGIPMNPDSLGLYKELAWIFFSKMGQTTDEMHMVYKQRWGAQMQGLLGTPPPGQATEVIDAFRPIADESLLDKAARRQGVQSIQADKLAQLLTSDSNAATYAARLDEAGVTIGQPLLDAYNRFSRDEGMEMTRVGRAPQIKTDADLALSKIINDASESASAGRNKLLAFVRAQILWNDYRMDPTWMLHMMTKYVAPLDWRMVQTHGLYWITFGLDRCGPQGPKGSESINTDRIVLNNLKALAWGGRLSYIENVRDPDSPQLRFSADWRFIEPTHQAHMELAKAALKIKNEALAEGSETIKFDKNKFRNGHVNFLIASIKMLYAGNRRVAAKEYLDWLKKEYPPRSRPPGSIWNMDLDAFVFETLHKDGRPIADVVRNQMAASIVAGFEQYAVGNRAGYKRSLSYALRIYRVHQEKTPKRNKFPPFVDILSGIVSRMLVQPQTTGIYLNIEARHTVYVGLHEQVKLRVYDMIAGPLRRQCASAYPPLDFDKAFPPPQGLEAFRKTHRRTFPPARR